MKIASQEQIGIKEFSKKQHTKNGSNPQENQWSCYEKPELLQKEEPIHITLYFTSYYQ